MAPEFTKDDLRWFYIRAGKSFRRRFRLLFGAGSGHMTSMLLQKREPDSGAGSIFRLKCKTTFKRFQGSTRLAVGNGTETGPGPQMTSMSQQKSWPEIFSVIRRRKYDVTVMVLYFYVPGSKTVRNCSLVDPLEAN